MPRLVKLGTVLFSSLVAVAIYGCSSDEEGVPKTAFVSIDNDFDNPANTFNPPWTICKASYMGVQFDTIAIGATSPEKQVAPGLDNVLMVAAWKAPDCNPAHALPIASRLEEEVVDGQHRTIAINLQNHQGACPPTGVAPIPQALYDRILALWPEYGFKPYAEKALNTQCVPSTPTGDAGADAQADAAADAGDAGTD
jgi:hypothetical protein